MLSRPSSKKVGRVGGKHTKMASKRHGESKRHFAKVLQASDCIQGSRGVPAKGKGMPHTMEQGKQWASIGLRLTLPRLHQTTLILF